MKRIVFILFGLIVVLCLAGCASTKQNDNPSKTVETHIHTYSTETVEPSCILEGYTLHKCSCGESYKDNIKAALGHSYVEREQNYKCSRCNRYEDEGFVFETITSYMANYNDSYSGLANTYIIKEVSQSALENGKLTIPRKHMSCAVTGIEKGALYNVRKQMTSIYIPSTIKYIGSSLVSYDGQFASSNDTIALTTITFDNNCSGMNVSHTCFHFCKQVTSISMPNNCIKQFNHDDNVGNHFLFEDTQYYKSNKTLNGGCYYLFNMLLETDKSLIGSTVTIKAGTTLIANQAFVGNTNIKTVEIPSSLKYIGKKAFAQCVSLNTIIYNGSESNFKTILVEENAFQDCKNISYQYK